MDLKVEAFPDEETATITYVLFDENTKDAVIIDPVLNYDSFSSIIAGPLALNNFCKLYLS